MNQNDYYKLLGKLEGMMEANQTSNHLFQLDDKIRKLQSQIKSAVVTDEVAELKAQLETIIADFKEARSCCKNADKHRTSDTEVYNHIITRLEALKSLEGKDG